MLEKLAQYIMSLGGLGSILMLGLYFKLANRIIKVLFRIALVILIAGIGIYLISQSGIIPNT